MTHKFGNKDYNLNHVISISDIVTFSMAKGDIRGFVLYFGEDDKNGIAFMEDKYPDLEGERAIIIGKLNQK